MLRAAAAWPHAVQRSSKEPEAGSKTDIHPLGLQQWGGGDIYIYIYIYIYLQSLGVDLEKIRVKSFVHMHLTTSKLIWNHMCERFSDEEKKALYVFLSRRWKSDDLLECEHQVVKCLCRELSLTRPARYPGLEPPFPTSRSPCPLSRLLKAIIPEVLFISSSVLEFDSASEVSWCTE